MRYRGKTAITPYPIWVMGEYIQEPPPRPCDGVRRLKGNYIDKGGYPGANVYEVSPETLCRESDSRDLTGKAIFEKDILRFDCLDQQGKISHAYCLAEFGSGGKLEIIDFLTGEILEPEENRLKIIGNTIDNENFMEDISRFLNETESPELPYIPAINVQLGDSPYWRLKCRKCGYLTLGAVFKTTCSRCSGFVDCTLTSEYKKESVSV